MRTIPRGALLAFVLMGAGPAVVTSSLAMAAEPAVYAGFPSGLAVDGYDPVAYFVEGRPVAGSPAFESRYADTSLPGCVTRSEEHTSELQSLTRISYPVFCYKKNTYTSTIPSHTLITHAHTFTILT